MQREASPAQFLERPFWRIGAVAAAPSLREWFLAESCCGCSAVAVWPKTSFETSIRTDLKGGSPEKAPSEKSDCGCNAVSAPGGRVPAENRGVPKNDGRFRKREEVSGLEAALKAPWLQERTRAAPKRLCHCSALPVGLWEAPCPERERARFCRVVRDSAGSAKVVNPLAAEKP